LDNKSQKEANGVDEKSVDLRVRVGDITLRNPIILSPGPLGRSPMSMKQFAEAGCAAVCSKTLSAEPWEGNPSPKKLNLSYGWILNAEGGPNMGIQAFSESLKRVRGKIRDSHVIISVVGKTIEEFISLAQRAEEIGANILDLDITCPNTSGKGVTDSWQKDLNQLHDLICAVKDKVSVPLWIKFISSYGTLLEIAKTLEAAGADALVPLVSIGAMAIDVETGKPKLGFKHGVGIATGPPLKYAELKAVADVRRTVKIPVIATGGCSSGLDVVEFLMAGACGVEIHSSFMQNGKKHVDTMLSQLTQFMEKKGWKRLEDLVGMSLRYLPKEPFPVWYRQV
jgi:dihydroorotate dehydrogenase (NAD+) catalytic subunit